MIWIILTSPLTRNSKPFNTDTKNKMVYTQQTNEQKKEVFKIYLSKLHVVNKFVFQKDIYFC